MLRHYACSALQKFDAAQDLLTVQRMFAHSPPFFFRKLRRLSQERVRHSNLADVVQQRSEFQRLHLIAVQSILASESQTVTDHALRVPVSFRVARFECRSQRLECRTISAFQRIQSTIEFGGALFNQLFEMVFIALLCHYEIVMLERAFDHSFHLSQIKRLHQVIERAESQSTNRTLDGLHAADHHNHSRSEERR